MWTLFLRSGGGISHHPDEAVNAGDVALTLGVLVDFLHRLAEEVS
jgi:allantoate deiminase